MIIPLTKDNLDKYFQDYKKIYEKQFKVKFDKNTLKNQLENSKIYLYVDSNDKLLGFVRVKYINIKDKYLKHIKSKRALFLSDIAVLKKNNGVGTKLMKYIIKLSEKEKIPIITVPWNDKLLQYYTRFGFGAYYFKEPSLPKVILVRPPKKDQIVKPIVEQIIIKPFLEDKEILLEDDGDDSDDSDSDFGSDDSDEDEDNNDIGDFDLQSKNEIAIIKSTIDKLIAISEHMLVVKNSDFYEILSDLYKIRYLFTIYINNYNSYEDKEHNKIITLFKKSITSVISKLNKQI